MFFSGSLEDSVHSTPGTQYPPPSRLPTKTFKRIYLLQHDNMRSKTWS